MGASILVGAAGVSLMSPARSDQSIPRRFAGAMAGAAITLPIVLPSAQRTMLLASPTALLIILAAISIHLVWGFGSAFNNSALRSDDFRIRVETFLSEFVPPAVARVAAAEIMVIRYVFAFRTPPKVPRDSIAFSYHRSGVLALVWIVAARSVIEATLVHLVIRQWSEFTAILVSGLSELSVVYLIGLANSFRCLPTLADADGLHFRLGILIDEKIEWEKIADVVVIKVSTAKKKPDVLRVAAISAPNIRIRLVAPTKVKQLFHSTREVVEVEAYLDDPQAFCRMVLDR